MMVVKCDDRQGGGKKEIVGGSSAKEKETGFQFLFRLLNLGIQI